MSENVRQLAAIVRDGSDAILTQWLQQQNDDATVRNNLLRSGDLEAQSRELLDHIARALDAGSADTADAAWEPVREQITSISRSRARQGLTAAETATFIFSLKRVLFDVIRSQFASHPQRAADLSWFASEVLDRLGLLSTDTYQKGREDVIARQQQELLELSTPVVRLWDGVLALPLIGTLDSARTQVVMESLLQAVVQTGSAIAIIDITGVPLVDTLVAQHLLKTVAAARLMGADCIISGIRPQIAQTIVHLGVELSDVTTKATLADAFRVALARLGLTVTKRGAAIAEPMQKVRAVSDDAQG